MYTSFQLPKYSVIVAEDEPRILQFIVSKIKTCSDRFDVVAAAYNGVDALEAIEKNQPHLLLTDIHMPQMNGLELIRATKERSPDTSIVMVSGYNDFEYVKTAMQCGAKDYLLKPVNTANIQEILERMSSDLDKKYEQTIRARIQEQLFDQARKPAETLVSNADLLPTSDREIDSHSFHLMYIHLGQLPVHSYSISESALYQELWQRALQELATSKEPWKLELNWFFEPKHTFGKFLVIPTGACSEQDISAIAAHLEIILKASISPFPVNIVYVQEITALPKLGDLSRELIAHLQKRMVYGHTASIALADWEPTELSKWEMTAQHRIIQLLRSGNTEYLFQELSSWFCQKDLEGNPQKTVERHLLKLLALFHEHSPLASEQELSHMEFEMLSKLPFAANWSSYWHNIWPLLDSMLSNGDKEMEGAQELTNRIETYLKDHYTDPLNLEDISAKFNFSASYLTKIYKKYKGTTPLKYLITLRIEEAKRLIAQQPDLSFKEIGVQVGYPDQNYFSRIFKNTTGNNPSFFRGM